MNNIKMFLVRYAEIGTKGKNRYVFEDILCKRIRRRLEPMGEFKVWRDFGRIYNNYILNHLRHNPHSSFFESL